ncbi:MAG: sodium:proton exchanger [Beijerinckiaceae bacterium]|nr:MAG: sodium:proton exchanger [Beijerinckiaceae bacterium]
MTQSLNFLVLALVVVVLPVALLRFSGLKGLVPLVVVQIMVGIALGPSVFGRVAPGLFQMFINPSSIASISGIASIAVLIFGLITGLHLGPGILRDNGRMFAAVAAARVMIPAAIGCLAGFWILARHPEELPPGISPAEFAVAIGICIGTSALPVLGAILREMDLLGIRIGHLALGIAGINDVALWILLSGLLTARAGQVAGGHVGHSTLLLVPLYLVFMIRVVRPLLGRMVVARMRDEMVDERALAVVGAVTIASALATESMGLHYIIGAFVTGAVMPVNLRKPILDRLQVLTVALLMPFFFALTGMRTLIDPGSPAFLEVFFIATVAAVAGVVGATAVAARLFGASWPFALGLGALLQTKGLMEVIVLTILLDAGIISTNVFAALILMAVVSTALAMPLARLMLAREAVAGQQI